MDTQINIKVIDWLLWIILGCFCLVYNLFGSNFAEFHLALPFLNFPIFVGEILLGICVVLLMLKWRFTPLNFERWHYILFFYTGWILLKAFWGYFSYGPLAFRNAALFYYPLFAVISYSFYKREFFTQRTIIFLLIIFVVVKSSVNFTPYNLFPSFILFIILASKPNRWWLKIAAFGGLLFLFYPYKLFLQDSKSAIVGNMMGFLFLAICFSLAFLRVKRKYQILMVCFILFFLSFIFFKFVRKEQVKSLTTPASISQQFKELDNYISERKRTFHPKKLAVSLYNPEDKGLLDYVKVHSASPRVNQMQKKVAVNKSESEIRSDIEEKFEKGKLAVIQTIKSYRDAACLDIKNVIDSVEKQEAGIVLIDQVTEKVLQEAKNTIFQYKKMNLQNISKNEGQKYDLVLMTTIVDTVKKAVEEIQHQKEIIIKINKYHASKKSIPPPSQKAAKEPTKSATPSPAPKERPQEVSLPSPKVKESTLAYNPPSSQEAAKEQTKSATPSPAPKERPQEVSLPSPKVIENTSVNNHHPSREISKQQRGSLIEKDIEKRETDPKEAAMKEVLDRFYQKSIADKIYNSLDQEGKIPKQTAMADINQSIVSTPAMEQPQKHRSLDAEYNNMLFRLFIWRDMMDEFLQKSHILGNFLLGINLGEPQRSISLEILDRAEGEWRRDGWITPHNSYLHLIYRGGLVGLGIVIGLFILLSRLTKQFVSTRGTTGILLISILIYWAIITNFLVILEMPYNAIPFWTLVGMTVAYSKSS